MHTWTQLFPVYSREWSYRNHFVQRIISEVCFCKNACDTSVFAHKHQCLQTNSQLFTSENLSWFCGLTRLWGNIVSGNHEVNISQVRVPINQSVIAYLICTYGWINNGACCSKCHVTRIRRAQYIIVERNRLPKYLLTTIFCCTFGTMLL